jgi:hypothetical protein
MRPPDSAPTDPALTEEDRRNGRLWVMGILAAFALVFLANGLLVWFALDTAPQIDRTYESETR